MGAASKWRKRRRQSRPLAAQHLVELRARHPICLVAQAGENGLKFGRQDDARIHRNHLAQLHRRARRCDSRSATRAELPGVGSGRRDAAARRWPVGAHPRPASRPPRRPPGDRTRPRGRYGRWEPPHGFLGSSAMPRHSGGRGSWFRAALAHTRDHPGGQDHDEGHGRIMIAGLAGEPEGQHGAE